MAWPRRISSSICLPPHRMVRSVVATSPCTSRSSRLLPAPFGPRMTVMPGSSTLRSTLSINRRLAVSSERRLSSSGNTCPEEGAPVSSTARDLGCSSIGKVGGEPSNAHQGHIDDKRNGKKDHAESKGKGNIAFRCLERNCRGHGSRHMIDITTDDHDCADLGDGAAKTRKHCRDPPIAAVPKECRHHLCR